MKKELAVMGMMLLMILILIVPYDDNAKFFINLIYRCFVPCKATTIIDFESYNQLDDLEEEYNSEGIFVFESNSQRYRIMGGDLAEHRGIIEEVENYHNWDRVVMVDSEGKAVFSIFTEEQYILESIRECTDIDGEVYIMYSKWSSIWGKNNLSLEYLKNTHILKMDMENFQIKNQYDYGESVIVMTVHNGYVYTMEDGRVYKKLLDEANNKECMADLGFRGMPDSLQMSIMTFCTEADSIRITASIPDEYAKHGWRDAVLADVKYTDEPLKSRRHFRDRLQAD